MDLIARRIEAADWLFMSNSNKQSAKGAPLTTVSLSRICKHWTTLAGLDDTYGSHWGRKSFGYLNRVERGVGIEKLQKAYGHSSPSITMAYICIQDDDMKATYREAF